MQITNKNFDDTYIFLGLIFLFLLISIPLVYSQEDSESGNEEIDFVITTQSDSTDTEASELEEEIEPEIIVTILKKSWWEKFTDWATWKNFKDWFWAKEEKPGVLGRAGNWFLGVIGARHFDSDNPWTTGWQIKSIYNFMIGILTGLLLSLILHIIFLIDKTAIPSTYWMAGIVGKTSHLVGFAIIYSFVMLIPILNRIIEIITLYHLPSTWYGALIWRPLALAIIVGFIPELIVSIRKYRVHQIRERKKLMARAGFAIARGMASP
jgi:hypothetical protein